MSSQFYKYLAKKTFEYFTSSKPQAGDRFFVEFDNLMQAKEYYSELSLLGLPVKMNFSNYSYECYKILVGDINLLITTTDEKTKPDFLVTLRNKVSNQGASWENSSIIFILHESLDSIKHGSLDLRSENMPLNLDRLRHSLGLEIESSNYDVHFKTALKFSLEKINEDKYTKISINDYSVILGCIEKGVIENSDWSNLKLFNDTGLNDIHDIQAIYARLNLNFDIHEDFEDFYIYGDKRSISRKISEEFIDATEKDSWSALDFTTIQKYIENNNKTKATLVFIEKIESDLVGSNWFRVTQEKKNQYTINGFRVEVQNKKTALKIANK